MSIFHQIFLALLIDRRIHKEREQDGCGPVDRHAHRSPGIAEVEAAVEFLRIIDGGNADAGIADLSIDIGTIVGVFAVKGDGVECRTEADCGLTGADIVKTFVGALGAAFAREHPGGILFRSFQREYACREREFAGEILLYSPAEDISPIGETGYGDLRDFQVRKRLAVEGLFYRLSAHFVFEIFAFIPVARGAPFADEFSADWEQLLLQPFDLLFQG